MWISRKKYDSILERLTYLENRTNSHAKTYIDCYEEIGKIYNRITRLLDHFGLTEVYTPESKTPEKYEVITKKEAARRNKKVEKEGVQNGVEVGGCYVPRAYLPGQFIDRQIYSPLDSVR